LNWPKLKAGLLHTKNAILFWDLCWSALVSLHHPLNATKVLESACSFGKKIFKLLGEILQFTVYSSEEKACAKVLSQFGETTLFQTQHNFIFFLGSMYGILTNSFTKQTSNQQQYVSVNISQSHDILFLLSHVT